MGGYGSGRSSFIRRGTVETSTLLRMATIRKAGVLALPCMGSGGPQLVQAGGLVGWLQVRINADKSPTMVVVYRDSVSRRCGRLVVDAFRLCTTRPVLGGVRWWVVCHCSRRVANLYLPFDERYFRCRICHQLTYTCQREDRPDRLRRRAKKLLRRLGNDDVSEGRPKGMRHFTYSLILSRAAAFEAEAVQILCAKPFPVSWRKALGM